MVPRPGETCKNARAVAKEALDVANPRVGEVELPARVRHDDLARVVMPGEDEVERVGWNPPRDAREVAEEDAESRAGVRE